MACAIYTRKSSEEGLEQDFNSLQAQREACEAYVLSQRQEGWKLLPDHYDDGGYSGGTLDRPALRRLLEEVDRKRIRIVVVYKVDRLTRSLADFAKIVERFDAQGVSFVSVTQQFNTTSSMGRLTLNVLLSFAQFEREVTGERIRDKIAASKRKGLWMGGVAPIGYRGLNRTLEIEPDGAALVRFIYERYLALRCVHRLKQELDAQGIVSPKRVSMAGRSSGEAAFSRGQLYRILSHPVYLGQIVHREHVYPGQHPAIIERVQWEAVQAILAENRQGNQQQRSVPSASLLAGRVFDVDGNRLIPSHSRKQTQRYRYYVSEPLVTGRRANALQGIRIPAEELETVVVDRLRSWLADEPALLATLNPGSADAQRSLASARDMVATLGSAHAERYRVVQCVIRKVVVAQDAIQLTIDLDCLRGDAAKSRKSNTADRAFLTLDVPIAVRRCGYRARLLVQAADATNRPRRDERLINLIATALSWRERLTTGIAANVGEIAQAEGVTISHVTRMIYRSCLAPDIVRAILAGTQPPALTSEFLKHRLPLPLDWEEQRRLLGFESN